MPAIDERVAHPEAPVEHHDDAIERIELAIAGLRAEVLGFRTDMRTEMDSFRTAVRTDLQHMDQKIDQRFMWMIGLYFLTLLGVIGGMAAPY